MVNDLDPRVLKHEVKYLLDVWGIVYKDDKTPVDKLIDPKNSDIKSYLNNVISYADLKISNFFNINPKYRIKEDKKNNFVKRETFKDYLVKKIKKEIELLKDCQKQIKNHLNYVDNIVNNLNTNLLRLQSDVDIIDKNLTKESIFLSKDKIKPIRKIYTQEVVGITRITDKFSSLVGDILFKKEDLENDNKYNKTKSKSKSCILISIKSGDLFYISELLATNFDYTIHQIGLEIKKKVKLSNLQNKLDLDLAAMLLNLDVINEEDSLKRNKLLIEQINLELEYHKSRYYNKLEQVVIKMQKNTSLSQVKDNNYKLTNDKDMSLNILKRKNELNPRDPLKNKSILSSKIIFNDALPLKTKVNNKLSMQDKKHSVLSNKKNTLGDDVGGTGIYNLFYKDSHPFAISKEGSKVIKTLEVSNDNYTNNAKTLNFEDFSLEKLHDINKNELQKALELDKRQKNTSNYTKNKNSLSLDKN